MSLDTAIEFMKTNGNSIQKRDYLPFGMQYRETPKPARYKHEKMYAFTSVTFSTFKGIPLIDESD